MKSMGNAPGGDVETCGPGKTSGYCLTSASMLELGVQGPKARRSTILSPMSGAPFE